MDLNTVLGTNGILQNALKSAASGSRELERILTEQESESGVLGTTLIAFRKIDNMQLSEDSDVIQMLKSYFDRLIGESRSAIESFANEIPTIDADGLIHKVMILHKVVTNALLIDTRDTHLASIALAVQHLISKIASTTTELEQALTPMANEVIYAFTVTLQSLVGGVAGIVAELFAPISDDVGVIAEGLLDILVSILKDGNNLVEQIIHSMEDENSPIIGREVAKEIEALAKVLEEPVTGLTNLALNVYE